jgi:hypothetical protein
MSRFPLKKSQRQKHDLVTGTKTAFLVAKELIRSFQLQDKPYHDLDDPWGDILMACAKIYVPHDSAGDPGQLIFGRDMVLNVQHLTDWTAIKANEL